MGGSTSTFLKMVAGIALTLAIITFGFFIYNTVKGTGNRVLTKATDTTESMIESNITQYNRGDISGSEVLNAIVTFMDSSEEIYVEVTTHSGTNVYIYPNKNVAPDQRASNNDILDALQLAKQKGNAAYISPKGKFTGKVVYADNDDSIIVGISFTQN